ncbi:hypothetical protein ROG8370_03796 [Roseovarius gaetbuli]|uniref:Uncharacterized protein n=1 Tax=Roseovarius gaetbuli TaxID=1356575 RepID=A0A1X7AEE8_9RHOB|nr:hypothetical protein ROG8370_03796 [Roseovarius gaetbuli]
MRNHIGPVGGHVFFQHGFVCRSRGKSCLERQRLLHLPRGKQWMGAVAAGFAVGQVMGQQTCFGAVVAAQCCCVMPRVEKSTRRAALALTIGQIVLQRVSARVLDVRVVCQIPLRIEQADGCGPDLLRGQIIAHRPFGGRHDSVPQAFEHGACCMGLIPLHRGLGCCRLSRRDQIDHILRFGPYRCGNVTAVYPGWLLAQSQRHARRHDINHSDRGDLCKACQHQIDLMLGQRILDRDLLTDEKDAVRLQPRRQQLCGHHSLDPSCRGAKMHMTLHTCLKAGDQMVCKFGDHWRGQFRQVAKARSHRA